MKLFNKQKNNVVKKKKKKNKKIITLIFLVVLCLSGFGVFFSYKVLAVDSAGGTSAEKSIPEKFQIKSTVQRDTNNVTIKFTANKGSWTSAVDYSNINLEDLADGKVKVPHLTIYFYRNDGKDPYIVSNDFVLGRELGKQNKKIDSDIDGFIVHEGSSNELKINLLDYGLNSSIVSEVKVDVKFMQFLKKYDGQYFQGLTYSLNYAAATTNNSSTCESFKKDGFVVDGKTYKKSDLTQTEQKYFDENFGFCRNDYDPTLAYDEKTIKAALVRFYNLLKNSSKEQFFSEGPDLTNVDATLISNEDLQAGIKLSCQALPDKNNKSDDLGVHYEYDEDTNSLREKGFSSKNTNKYKYSKATVSNSVCETVCTEVVTVSYGAPVAVKAGMCFEYKVQVRSSASCKVKVKKTTPPTMKKVCNPVPNCHNNTGFYINQGGPSEDFDSCISNCDNGNYSQECIDKCYNKVYSDNTSNADDVSMLNNDKSTSLALSYNSNSKNNIVNLSNSSCPTAEDYNYDPSKLADAVWKYMHSGVNHGFYKSNGGSIVWVPSSDCVWDKYARFYFSTEYLNNRTVYGHLGECYGGDCYRYEPDNFGFKRATYGYSTCGDYCTFDGCSSNDLLNYEDAKKDYEKELADYESKLNECTNNVICNDKVAEYHISVNTNGSGSVCLGKSNPTTLGNSSSSDDYCFDFSTNQKQNTTFTSSNIQNNLIITDFKSICSGDKDAPDHFQTTFSFPGDWIDLKNGKVLHGNPSSEVGWEHHENQFCLPTNISSVNSKWFKWHLAVTSNSLDNISSLYDDAERENRVYNIAATVRNFGKFFWNFDVSCFYAYDKESTITSLSDFGVRSININRDSEQGLFNSNRPYNWSYESSNYINENYQVNPIALESMILSKKSSIYKNDDDLDYSITLTKQNIKSIKDEIKSCNGSYSCLNGTIIKSTDGNNKGNINSYKSNFWSRSVVTVNKRPLVYGCNNQKDSNHCDYNYSGKLDELKGLSGNGVSK